MGITERERHQRATHEYARTTGGTITRRRLLGGALVAGFGLALGSAGRGAPAAADNTTAEALAAVPLPPDRGQSELTVYVPETGHTLRGSMLDYWRANGAAAIYGNPVSEPFASADGYYSQAFERAIFQYRPEFVDTEDPIIRLMPVGELLSSAPADAMRASGHRTGGGGDRRHGIWQPLAANSDSVKHSLAAGGVFVEASGHTLSAAVGRWYQAMEGDFYLGHPLTEAIAGRGVHAQYFEGGLVLIGKDGISLAPLSPALLRRLGVPTKRVPQGDVPTYDEALFATEANPAPQSDGAAVGRKRIEVSLSEQRLWAYQGDTPLLTTLVSTGLAPNNTAPGRFHIRMKFPKQTMQGFSDGTGEVVAVGTERPSSGNVTAFKVPDVPNVMYFSISAEALHGAYWHNNFGNPMSHGCINLPLDVAAWMYGWAPLGVEVTVRD